MLTPSWTGDNDAWRSGWRWTLYFSRHFRDSLQRCHPARAWNGGYPKVFKDFTITATRPSLWLWPLRRRPITCLALCLNCENSCRRFQPGDGPSIMKSSRIFVSSFRCHPVLPSPESSQPCEEESQPGVWGTVEDVIDILFHRKVTAAQTFVLKLFVSDLKIKYFSNKKTYTIDLISLPLHLFKVICLNVFGISLNLCSC